MTVRGDAANGSITKKKLYVKYYVNRNEKERKIDVLPSPPQVGQKRKQIRGKA